MSVKANTDARPCPVSSLIGADETSVTPAPSILASARACSSESGLNV